ncbi:MAG: ECF transporter S component [Oscillospiraceae bacterium]|nr:ECF transporter S component [Oscillospiraceae bacterium]
MEKSKKFDVRKITGLALLTAIVVVLQILTTVVARLGMFTFTIALVPIVVGAALYGWKAGAWLGFVFGALTLLDANAFFVINIPGTIVTCLVKGTMAGLVAGLAYKLVEKKNKFVAVLTAAVAAPIMNTGFFIIGCLLFFIDYVKQLAGDTNAFVFILVGFVGINFFIELGVNLVLSPTIVRLVKLGKRSANT